MYLINYCVICGSPMEDRMAFGEMRRVCIACGFIHFRDPKVAVAVMIHDQGRVLLVKRAINPERGKWALPAGYVNATEDPRQAAIREAHEETGLQVVVVGLIDVLHNPPDPAGRSVGASIIIVYEGQTIGGTLCAGDDAEAVGWFAPDALPPIAFESKWRAVQVWLAQRLS